jgi:pimeloyl-ACP methyl ester carboxylesterase
VAQEQSCGGKARLLYSRGIYSPKENSPPEKAACFVEALSSIRAPGHLNDPRMVREELVGLPGWRGPSEKWAHHNILRPSPVPQDFICSSAMVLGHSIPFHLSKSSLAILEECGHLSTLEQPEQVTDALREWLLRIETF